MDYEKELLQISDEMQIEFIEAMERALKKIADKKIGGTSAQKIISYSILSCWTLWLKQMTANRRAKLFSQGCDVVADRLLELAKEERLGSTSFTQ